MPSESERARVSELEDPLAGRKLKVGIISPYSFETPGGVQLHIRDFAKQLISRGHDVEVLAPGRRTHDMPLWVQTTGSSFAIPYNGSVANLSYFGWVGSTTRRWVKQGHFDIVHLHEPEVPSISHKPLIPGFDPCPYVATFHASFDTYPLALKCTQLYLRSYLSNIRSAICVSDSALETASHYLDPATDISVIPNGINTASFIAASKKREWQGTPESPTIGFLGRMGEDRKGFAVFARAASYILERYPKARFLCVGDGESDGRKILSSFPERLCRSHGVSRSHQRRGQSLILQESDGVRRSSNRRRKLRHRPCRGHGGRMSYRRIGSQSLQSGFAGGDGRTPVHQWRRP
jgi:phosphatidyl-myo-inositol alpha-mannosyltransferase